MQKKGRHGHRLKGKDKSRRRAGKSALASSISQYTVLALQKPLFMSFG